MGSNRWLSTWSLVVLLLMGAVAGAPAVRADADTPEIPTRLLTGHTGAVLALTFAPDGRLLASGSSDQTIRLWDPTTGRTQGVLRGHTGAVHALAFAANHQWLVSGSADGTVRLWALPQGTERQALPGRFGAIRGVAFAPDPRVVASVGEDGSLRLWEWAGGKEIRAVKSRGVILHAVAVAPDGLTVATGGSNALAHLWDVATLGIRQTLTGHTGAVYTVAFAPHDALLSTGGDDGVIRLWDLTTGQERRALAGHRGAVSAVAFALDGQTLVSTGADGTVRLWEVATGRVRTTLMGHTGPGLTVALAPDGALLASGGQDRTIRLMLLRDGPVAVASVGPPSGPPATAVSPPPAGQTRPTERLQETGVIAHDQGIPAMRPHAVEPSATPPTAPAPSPPVIALATPADGQQATSDRIQLRGAAASNQGVVRVEVRVNGQLLTQRDGRGGEATTHVEFSEWLAVREGTNEIVVTAFGPGNRTTTRTVTVTRVTEQGKLWAVVVGISRYKAVNALVFADRDARAFHDYLRTQLGLSTDQVTLLTNQEATLFTLRHTLGTALKQKVGPRDTVIIYFAGHGVPETEAMSPDGDGLEKYLVPYDADPDDLYTTALPMREIEVIFQRLAAERIIFLADTCFSGAAGGRTLSAGSHRALVSEAFWARLAKAKGRVILSASRANEVSVERDDLGHGVFTYYVLEGLHGKADFDRDGVITVDELYTYIADKIPAATAQNQHPVKKGEVDGPLVLGRVP